MGATRRDVWRACRLAGPIACAVLASCRDAPAPPPVPLKLPAIQVAYAAAPLPLSYTARIRGEREVEVRARVSGILLRRFYTEGAAVRAGERLFQIDPAPFAAEVRSAEGRLAMAEARLKAADREWRRSDALAEAGAISRRSFEEAEADYSAGKAAVAVARAELAQARLNLGYTDVRAPISGVTGREARAEGSLVKADEDSALLTTLTQTRRLFVEFAMPDAEAGWLRAALAADPHAIGVRLRPGQGAPLPILARIDFISARVAEDTGTVDVRATFENAAGLLSPGQFVRAELTGLSTAPGIYVPIRALAYSAEGPFVWKIDAKGRARMQPVAAGAVRGDFIAVERGLAPGDRVIVEGAMKLQPDMAVEPIVASRAAAPDDRAR